MKDFYQNQVKQEEHSQAQVLIPHNPNTPYYNQKPKIEAKDEIKSKKIYKKKYSNPRRPVRRGGKFKSTRNGLDKNLFFKTRICPFLLSGHCSKRERCTYAHSQTELRDPPNLKKTKLCQQFLLGMCQMGNRCSYAHGEHELRSMEMFKFKGESLLGRNDDYEDNSSIAVKGEPGVNPAFSFVDFNSMAGNFRMTGNQSVGYSMSMFNNMNQMNQNFNQNGQQAQVKQENNIPIAPITPQIVQNPQQFMQAPPMMQQNPMMQAAQNPVMQQYGANKQYPTNNQPQAQVFNQGMQNFGRGIQNQFGLPGQIQPQITQQLAPPTPSFNPEHFTRQVQFQNFEPPVQNTQNSQPHQMANINPLMNNPGQIPKE